MAKLSVVMPVYNGARFLREAIDSVLSQSFSDFEFIIVDDGSTDDTHRIIADYADRDSRIIYYSMSQNSGIVAALNFGVDKANGQYIARMDADDICLPNRFGAQVTFLDSSEVAAVGANYVKFCGTKTGGRITNLPLSPDEVSRTLPYACCLGHPVVIFRKDVFERVGCYDPRYATGGAEDYDLWLRMSVEHNLANLPNTLLRYRRHSGSLTASAMFLDRYAFNSACAVANHFCSVLQIEGVYPEQGAEAILQALSMALDKAENEGQRKCLMRWNIRLSRYCPLSTEEINIAKSAVVKHATFKEKLKWRVYGLGALT